MLPKYNHVVAVVGLLAIILMASGGCAVSEPQDDEQISEPPSEAVNTVETFWAAFAEGNHESMEALLKSEDDWDIDLNLHSLSSKHNISHDSDLFGEFRNIQCSVYSFEKLEDGILITTAVEHPHVKEQQVSEIEDMMADEVFSQNQPEEKINLTEIFNKVCQQFSFESEESRLKMTLVEDNDQWLITEMDSPRKMFDSFDELFQRSVCEPAESTVVKLGQDNLLNENSPTQLTFRGKDVQTDWRLLPDCLVEEAQISFDNDQQLSAVEIVDSLAGHPFDWQSLAQWLDFGALDFLHRGRFVFHDEMQVGLALSRPYAVATIDSVIGYMDLTSEETNFFEMIPGPVDDLKWSPDGEHIAVSWTQAGKGGADVSVYSISGEEAMSFTELKGIEHHINPIQQIRWVDEGNLQIDVRKDSSEEVSWLLDVSQQRLKDK